MMEDARTRLRAMISLIARTGRVTAEDVAMCRRVEQGTAILNVVYRLGYLTAQQIRACTGITDGLGAMLQQLCDEDCLQTIDVNGFDRMYWIGRCALSELEVLEIPGVGSADISQLSNPHWQRLYRCGVSDPMVMQHTVALADLAVALYRSFNGLIIGERTLRIAEKVVGPFGTSNTGHCPDVVAVSPAGEVTVYEVECSVHPYPEFAATVRSWNTSEIAKAIYLPIGAAVARRLPDVFDRVDREAEELGKPEEKLNREKVVVVPSNGKRLPRLADVRPVGAGRLHRSPDLARQQLPASINSTSHPRPHFQSGRPRSASRPRSRANSKSSS